MGLSCSLYRYNSSRFISPVLKSLHSPQFYELKVEKQNSIPSLSSDSTLSSSSDSSDFSSDTVANKPIVPCTRSLKALDKLFKQAKKRQFKCMVTNKAYIEGTARKLLEELDRNKDGKLDIQEIRTFCEKVIKKAAGVGWRF